MLGTNAEHFFSPFKKIPPKIPPSEIAQAEEKEPRRVGRGQLHANEGRAPYFVKQFNIPRALIVPKIGKGLNLKDLKKLRMKGMSATHL